MLQWMGGSRRKVTTSRKSTHNRQKQYFEQRKRQQQAPGQENYPDGRNKRVNCHEKPRSLDILSMTNFATVDEQGCACCDNEGDVSKLNSRGSNSSPAIPLFNAAPRYCVEPKETAQRALDSEADTPYQKKSSAAISPDNALPSHKSSVKKGVKLYEFKVPASCDDCTSIKKDAQPDEQEKMTANQLSVLDLLNDDGFHCTSEGRSAHEAHVSFSVEGLGKIGMETPVHSPRQLGRRDSFVGFCSLPKALRKVQDRNKKSVSDELNVMMHGIKMSIGGSPSELLTNLRGLIDCSGNSSSSSFRENDRVPLDAYASKIDNLFTKRENFNNSIKGREEQKWNAKFGIIDDDYLDDRKHDAEWRNQPYYMDNDTYDFPEVKYSEMYNLGFEDTVLDDRRAAVKAQKGIGFSELSVPYSKLSTSENYDNVSSDCERFPAANKILNFEDIISPAAWSFLATEDALDNISLLSEESCASTTVRDERTSYSNSWKLKENRSNHKSKRHKSSDNKYSILNITTEEMMNADLDEILQGKKMMREGSNCVSNHWRSETGHCFKRPSTFEGILVPDNISSFERGYSLVNKDLAPNSALMSSSEAEASLDCMFLSEENQSHISHGSPKLHSTTQLSHSKSKPHGHVSSGRLHVNEDALREASGSIFQLMKPTTHPLEKESQIPYSSCSEGSGRVAELPDTDMLKNVGKDNESESEMFSPGCIDTSKEVGYTVPVMKNDFPSENHRTTVISGSMDKCSKAEDSKDGISELLESPRTGISPEQAQSPTTTKEVSVYPDHSTRYELDHFDGGIPKPSHNSNTEPEKENYDHDECEEDNNTKPAYKVMLEGYVQLLCVQKATVFAIGSSSVASKSIL